MKRIKNNDKILIIRLSSMGDIIILTPVIKSLRQKFPNAEIDFIVKKSLAPLIELNPYLSKVITFDITEGLKGWVKLCQSLAEKKYHLFIDMHNNLRSWILSILLLKVPQLRYYKPRLQRFLLFYFCMNLFPKTFSLLDQYYKIIKDIDTNAIDPKPEIYLSPSAKEQANLLLKKIGIKKPFVVILAIAAWANKRYPQKKYEKVARLINEELNLTVIWLGGKNDSYLDELTYLKSGKSAKLVGETKLEQSLAILSLSSLVIGNDTGLTYAAEGLGVPIVLVLGPTSRETGAGHYLKKSITLERDIWCRPCSQRGNRRCYRKLRYCFEDISPDEIFQVARHIIEGI